MKRAILIHLGVAAAFALITLFVVQDYKTTVGDRALIAWLFSLTQVVTALMIRIRNL